MPQITLHTFIIYIYIKKKIRFLGMSYSAENKVNRSTSFLILSVIATALIKLIKCHLFKAFVQVYRAAVIKHTCFQHFTMLTKTQK